VTSTSTDLTHISVQISETVLHNDMQHITQLKSRKQKKWHYQRSHCTHIFKYIVSVFSDK